MAEGLVIIVNLIDYIALTAIAAMVAGAIFWILHRRKQGRNACCNCLYSRSCNGSAGQVYAQKCNSYERDR